MIFAYEKEHLKIVIWTVLDSCADVWPNFDSSEGPGLTALHSAQNYLNSGP
jgi:hypothetical protein